MKPRWNAVIGSITALGVALILSAIGASGAAAAPSEGALGANKIQTLQVAGNYGVPADAQMVAATVTAVQPAQPGHATVFPCDDDVPTASNVNYRAGDVTPNLALTKLSDDGTICVDTHARSDILIDIVGYVPNGSSITPLDQPRRVRDTRSSSKPGDASTIRVQITGRRGIPDHANVVMFNLTAANADIPGHASVRSCDAPRADGSTSSLNYTPARTTANFVVSRLSNDGAVCIDVLTSTHLIIDIVATARSGIVTLPEPIRIRDTRQRDPVQIGDTGIWHLPPGSQTVNWIDIEGHPEIPPSAGAALYNLTATGASTPGHASSYPCDEADASSSIISTEDLQTSNLNYVSGRATAATTITRLSGDGGFCVYLHTHTDIVVDLIGYVAGSAHYTAIQPIRLWDSRTGWIPTCKWAGWRSFGADGVELMNLVTGEKRALHLPGGNPEIIDLSNKWVPPLTSDDCRFVWLLRPDDEVEVSAGLHQFRSDGTSTRADLPDTASEWGLGSFRQGDGGRLLWIEDGSGDVFDVQTGDPVAIGPTEGLVDLWVVASAVNRSGVYTFVIDSAGSDYLELVTSPVGGPALGTFYGDENIRMVDVSDDATRVLAIEESQGATTTTFSAWVVTPGGTLIDKVASAPMSFAWAARNDAVSARFLPDGRVRWCVANQRIGDWTPNEGVEWYHPVPEHCY